MAAAALGHQALAADASSDDAAVRVHMECVRVRMLSLDDGRTDPKRLAEQILPLCHAEHEAAMGRPSASGAAEASDAASHEVELDHTLAAVLLLRKRGLAAPRPSASTVDPPLLSPKTGVAHDRAVAIAAAADPQGAVFRVAENGTVAHIASGARCPLEQRPLVLQRLFINPSVAPGDDVGCDYSIQGGKFTIFVTRSGPGGALAASNAMADMIKSAHPQAVTAGQPTVIISGQGIAAPIAKSFTVSEDGQSSRVSFWVAQTKGWVVEVMAAYPTASRQDVESTGAVATFMELLTISKLGGN